MPRNAEDNQYTPEELAYVLELKRYAQDFLDETYSTWDNYTTGERETLMTGIEAAKNVVLDANVYAQEYSLVTNNRRISKAYRVTEGDTLLSISNAFYGTNRFWHDIMAFNGKYDPRLTVGETIYLE